MSQPIHDTKAGLQKIEAALLPGEGIEAVFDLKSIGTTNKPVIVYDGVFLRKMKGAGLRSAPRNRSTPPSRRVLTHYGEFDTVYSR